MSLTKHQLNLLIENDYNIGKFYIALNTKDDNFINWFTFYDIELTKIMQKVKVLKEEIKIWESANQFERETIIKKLTINNDNDLKAIIDKNTKIVRGLSNVIHEITGLAAENKLDPQHISENNLMTELLENISDINDNIFKLKSMIKADKINYEKEISAHTKELYEELEHAEAEIVSHTKNKALMKERQQWLCDTFEISEEEKQRIIKKYGRQ